MVLQSRSEMRLDLHDRGLGIEMFVNSQAFEMLCAQIVAMNTTRPLYKEMQLLSLSKVLQALDAGVHHTILDLPGCAFRPEHAAHICAIMRHLLEDPATLQAAMEAEIRSALNQKISRSGENPAQPNLVLKTFLSQMATIIGRDPSIFFEALMSTCYVTRMAGRPLIQLKPTQKPATAKDKALGKAGEEAGKAEEQGGPSQQGIKEGPPPSTGQKSLRKRLSVDLRTPKTKEETKARQTSIVDAHNLYQDRLPRVAEQALAIYKAYSDGCARKGLNHMKDSIMPRSAGCIKLLQANASVPNAGLGCKECSQSFAESNSGKFCGDN